MLLGRDAVSVPRDRLGRMKKYYLLGILIILGLLSVQHAHAADFYKEVNLIGGYSHEDDWMSEKGGMIKNSVGCEWYKKFANEYGDFLTANLQVRTSFDSREDSDDAWAIEIHNAWLEYKLGLGRFIRVGHFDPAFGLEPVLDTHGTLLQTLASYSVGYKKDWGVNYKGMVGAFDYDCALQLGSGMSIRHKDNSFLLTGRIGTPPGKDVQYGLSFLYGRVLTSRQMRTIPVPDLATEDASRKKQMSGDLQYTFGPFRFHGECAMGKDRHNTVGGALGQIEYTLPRYQNILVKTQGHYWSHNWRENDARDIQIASVLEYKATSFLTFRLGCFHDLYRRTGKEDTQILLQLYYFG